MTTTKTVIEVLQSTTAYFQKHQIEGPRLNAEHLLAHVLGKSRMELYLEFERVLSETELAPLRELVKRRGQKEPLQHLLGTAEFCGQVFGVDKRALVPRPETEELVELIIAECRSRKAKRIIDVGTGSGVIALSLAKQFPEANITAIDISEGALALAKENAVRLGLSDRVRFEKADLLENLPEKFDLIVANLPYVSMRDRHLLAPEVLHDPEIALFAGPIGDEVVRRLIEVAPGHLSPGGLLALEIGINQAEGLTEFLRQKNYHDIGLKKDYAGISRFLLARYG
ncbi:MAG TPA: peptide chain release factor N(5)-glutamine methyltransferase [Chthoniobacterales bacterium]|nr:peptide chain release factor N(5)-glutamine methyltransferase [Chthoniobacterales bacterium]